MTHPPIGRLMTDDQLAFVPGRNSNGLILATDHLNSVIYIYIQLTPVGNEIWDKIGYNLACIRDICEVFCVYRGIFGDGLSDAANRILP